MGEHVVFASNGSTCQGYLSTPVGDSGEPTSGPAVIVIQEWWGLVGHITDVVDRLAAEGYVAMAPDLYHGVATDEPDDAMRLMMGLAMDTAARDIAGAATYLRSRDDVVGSGVGTIGFCLGGSLALWAATFSPDITAAVGFYPALPWERMEPTWANYAGKNAAIHCSEGDGTSEAPGIRQAVSAITAASGEVEVFDYPGTHHAFFNSDRPEVFQADAAEQAWARTLTFFGRHLA
jgi:carboxymethylenebutenolidase